MYRNKIDVITPKVTPGSGNRINVTTPHGATGSPLRSKHHMGPLLSYHATCDLRMSTLCCDVALTQILGAVVLLSIGNLTKGEN